MHKCAYHDYKGYSERPVTFTLATRQLREVARVSEGCDTLEEWEEVLDLIEQAKNEVLAWMSS